MYRNGKKITKHKTALIGTPVMRVKDRTDTEWPLGVKSDSITLRVGVVSAWIISQCRWP